MLLVAGNMLPMCIQQQTGNKLATILLPATRCFKQHVEGNMLPGNMLPGVNAALGNNNNNNNNNNNSPEAFSKLSRRHHLL